MTDQFQRTIDYLRISLTDRCNLRCTYCMPEEGVKWLPHAEILTYEEILRLCRVFADLGISKIKLTGGEPLLRKGLPHLVAGLKATEGICCVTLTTNGLLLADQLPALMEAGLDGVNISLDTLDPVQFKTITRREGLDRVLAGLDAALSYENLSVKLNCLPLGINDDQLISLAGLAKDRPLAIRFIELMPIGQGSGGTYRTEEGVRALLEGAFGPMMAYNGPMGNGPSHYFTLPGFAGKVGFISAMSHSFCHQCNRVRLTAQGFLKTCLQYEEGADLKPLLRRGGSDQELLALVADTIHKKPVHHRFREDGYIEKAECRGMSQIGG